MEGRTKRIPVHLSRGPVETPNFDLQAFYDRLLRCVSRFEAREGDWKLLDCMPAWEGNWTSDCFICFSWRAPTGSQLLAVVNFAPNQSQCYVRLPLSEGHGKRFRLMDVLGAEVYDRAGDEMASGGLYLDLPPWGYNVFDVSVVSDA